MMGFGEKEKKPKKLSLHKMVPNMITLTAMAFGMTAIKFAINGKFEEAVLAIVIATFMDAFDGAAARLLKAQSKLGAELDSLSDFACFGVAPALVVFLWSTHDVGRYGWIMALIFAMAVALRLARFNVMKEEKNDDPLSKYFTGVPSPVGAGLAVFPMIVSFQVGETHEAFSYLTHPYVAGIWMVIVGGMMVSNIPTFSSKQIRVPQKMTVPALGVFAVLIAGLINEPWPTLTFMGIVYLLLLPFGLRHYARKKDALEKGIKDPDDHDLEEID